MKIDFPTNLDFGNSIEFCLKMDEIGDNDTYTYDFKAISTVEPFGMLLVGAKMRNFISNHPQSKHYAINYTTNKYAAFMGFYQSIFLDFGNKPGEAPGSNTYLPITKIKISQLHEEAETQGEYIYNIIERKSEQLAVILSRGNNNLCDYLAYSITELMRNIIEHSSSDSIWIAGQYWPSKNKVEISILDEGIGIRRSLEKNPKLSCGNDEQAILLALEPGISCMNIKKSIGVWDNSGYGLYMTSRICQKGGSFVICSGESAISMNNQAATSYLVSLNGTAVRMILNVSNITKISQELAELSKQGKQREQEYSKSVIQ